MSFKNESNPVNIQIKDDTQVISSSINRNKTQDDSGVSHAPSNVKKSYSTSNVMKDDMYLNTKSHNNHEVVIANKNNKSSKTDSKPNYSPRTAYQHILSNKELKSKFERLNFEFTMSEATHRKSWQKQKMGDRGIQKWLMCLCIGAFTGTCMFAVSVAVEYLTGVNLDWARDGLKQTGFGVGFIRFLGINGLFALISGGMVAFIAPLAAGSGIPDVKAYLNGSSIPGLFQMKTFVVKLVGVVFSVSARFIIGKEGPMVHAGAALASGLSLGRNKPLGFDPGLLYSFRNDADGKDLISCGAAAGVAAAFGAPIGGMLFALEEVCSFWQPGLTWRAFFSAATSNLVLTLLLGCVHESCGKISKASLINFNKETGSSDVNSIENGQYNILEFIFFVLMGAFGGLIGAAFNGINVQLCLWRKRYLRTPQSRLFEVLCVAVLTTVLLIGTPLLDSCRQTSTLDTKHCDSSIWEDGQYTCADDEFNPLASLLMLDSETTISNLFQTQSDCWPAHSLWLAGLVYFTLAVITYGISIPSGLFIPLILIGSNVGHVSGKYWNALVDDTFDVGTYSLIGASAVLGGSTRMTISLTAIVLEITNDIYFLMPIMMTIMVSKWVGDRCNSALYDSHVLLKDIPYLEPKISSWVPSYICAEDIMVPNVVTLPSTIDLQSLLNVLNNPSNHHQAFPVIDMPKKSVKWLGDHGWSQSDGQYIGMILRWHIYIMLMYRNFCRDPMFVRDPPPLLTRNDLTDRTWKHKKTITSSEFGVKSYELNKYYINFTPYMFLAPITVHRATPVLRIYNLFRGLGLRHLIVLSVKHSICGIITAHELEEAALEDVLERVHEIYEEHGWVHKKRHGYKVRHGGGSKHDGDDDNDGGKRNSMLRSQSGGGSMHGDDREAQALFEERIRFLKGQTHVLKTSANIHLHPEHGWELIEDEFNPNNISRTRNENESGNRKTERGHNTSNGGSNTNTRGGSGNGNAGGVRGLIEEEARNKKSSRDDDGSVVSKGGSIFSMTGANAQSSDAGHASVHT